MPTEIKTAVQARQGENSGRMPIVLGLSVLLIVAAFAALYVYSAIFPTHH